METQPKIEPNVQQAVPFFGVTNMEASLRFYVDGLGFVMTKKWTPDGEGKVRWCCLELGKAALMLQEYRKDHHPNSGRPEGELGLGVNVCFQCRDALAIYHQAKAHGLGVTRPFVGNGMWVTSLRDPDGYRIEFESVTDVPEETEYADSLG
jgi:catechol 2,3-dioxygenase-like lactoylglutathione lyase family enzyme